MKITLNKALIPPYVIEHFGEEQQKQWQAVYEGAASAGAEQPEAIGIADAVLAQKDATWTPPSPVVFEPGVVEAAEKSYQYVDSYEYESRQISPQAAGYNPVGGDGTKACSNCAFFVSPARCTVVSGEIAPNGVSNMWQADNDADDQPGIPVYMVPAPATGKEASAPVTIKAGAFAAAKPSLLTRLSQTLGLSPAPTPVKQGFFVSKAANGELRWFARYSNAWEDRDKEILTEAAHKEYVEWVNSPAGVMPELWLWHTKGTRFGEADWVDFADGFAHASGVVDSTPAAKAAVAYLESQAKENKLGVSHGFVCKQTGKYVHQYRTFEISVLPRDRAAVWTADFNMLDDTNNKEIAMAFTADRRKWLVDALGEDTVKTLESNSETAAKELRTLGVEYKEADPVVAEEAAKETKQQDVLVALAEQIGSLGTAINTIVESVKSIKTEVAAIKATEDEKISDAFLSKVSKALSGAQRPTESAANVVTDEKTKAAAGLPGALQPGDDFFAKELMKSFNFASGLPASGVGTEAAATVKIS